MQTKRKWMSLPHHWIHCPRMGKVINKLFIPSKTPLDEIYEVDIPPAYRFNLKIFLDTPQIENVGLVIDLTKIKRFYKSSMLQNRMQYSKMECQRHIGAPTDEQVESFINIVNAFNEQHSDDNKLILVHCTHGFNRTGYLIVSYLVQVCDMELDDAVMTFKFSRPPGIYKQEYLDALKEKYGFDGEIVAPEKPGWCQDDDTLDLDDEGQDQTLFSSESESDDENTQVQYLIDGSSETDTDILMNRKKRKKYRKFQKKREVKQAKFMKGVNGVNVVYDVLEIEKVHTKMQKLMKLSRVGFLGTQPVLMTHDNLQYLTTKPYCVSWKADGTRYMMLISKTETGSDIYMIDRDNSVFKVDKLYFPCPPESNKIKLNRLYDTVLDGEMVIDIYQGVKTARFLVFDVIALNGEYIGYKPFMKRMYHISNQIMGWRIKLLNPVDREHESFSVRCKDFFPLTDSYRLWEGEFRSNVIHNMDGLVFQPADIKDVYTMNICPKILKWKPPELISVDFKLKCVFVEASVSEAQHWEGLLYVDGLNDPLVKLPNIKKADRIKYNNKVVECSYDRYIQKWSILKDRPDKLIPNHYSTVQVISKSIEYPVTIQDVYDVIKKAQKKGLIIKR